MIVPILLLALGQASTSVVAVNDGRDPATAPTMEPASPRIAELQPDAGAGWRFSVTPYFWLLGMDGDVRIRNTTADFDVGFDEILENLDLALMARMEAWRGRLGFYLDPFYSQLETEAESGGADVDLETELILVDFGVLYRVLEQHGENGRTRAADVSIGGRYSYLKNEIDFALAADRVESTDFVDLTLGARYGMDLTDRFGFLVAGDVGGFELGSSSELAWNLQALGSLDVGSAGRLWAGYRILDYDRDTGGSSGMEIQLSGPIIGYEFRF